MRDALLKTKAAKRVIRFGNLNPEIRASFWLHRVDRISLENKLRAMVSLKPYGSLYEAVIKSLGDTTAASESQESALPFKLRDEIEKDLKRTNTCERV